MNVTKNGRNAQSDVGLETDRFHCLYVMFRQIFTCWRVSFMKALFPPRIFLGEHGQHSVLFSLYWFGWPGRVCICVVQ